MLNLTAVAGRIRSQDRSQGNNMPGIYIYTHVHVFFFIIDILMMMYIFVLYIDRICHIPPSLYIIHLYFFGVCCLQLHPKGGLQTGPGTWSYSEIGASLEDLYFQRSDAQRRAACFFLFFGGDVK